ncbi:SRPBCC domain-containing protein [Alkalihalobacillus sp. AL-G]|uniref:SRPBCC family protein n=1 Tax=Alkalihalobacillus sp. AL-G TaxID=2926399 RepID=UPI00272D26E5|nr:SRPBCC domain-containing protein [Alkalihalobacillus sp. AL-G]WLD93306.1 SRPBCC domain-containing protein [Alkalihalobacillus sp. AL-G]
MKPEISLDFQYASPIEKVWHALTDSNMLAKWVMENNFKPIVGYKFQFRTEPNKYWDGIVDSEVLVVEEPYKLSYTWVTAGENTKVTWTLKKNGDITHLHLEHTGFKSESLSYNGAKYGWVKMSSELKKLLAEY